MLQTIWDQLDEIFGPILHPIIDPIFTALQDTALRAMLLSSIIWSCLVIGGLIFIVHEGPILLNLIIGSKPTLPRTIAPKSTTRIRQQSGTAGLHRAMAERTQKEGKERESHIQASGVRVTTKLKKMREAVSLQVTVHNGSDSKIDMVVVDLDLPAGIDPAIGSFRMQRLGSIPAGQTESKEFLLNLRGGDLSKLGGYVEFLGASYEVSKISLPVIEVEA
ncbi:MAG: hypothetical protein BV458_08920 [Thermoplasmata archaeon M9B2D]|nr:MAG: hypothetical protein BV458_08920 [Thermoplasmata archaeon M9B2D]